MRNLTGLVEEVEQESGNGVRHHRAFGSQDAIACHVDPSHPQDVLKLRGVAHCDLEEENRLTKREVSVLPYLSLLQEVLTRVACIELVRDHAELPTVHFGNEPLRRRIDLDPFHAYFRRTPHP